MENDILTNDPESISYRRNCNTLVVFGTGVAIFGLWSTLKFIGYLIFGIPILTGEELAEFPDIFYVIVIILTLLILLGDVALRFIVMRRARAEGLGRKVNVRYLIVLGIIIIYGCTSVAYAIQDFLSVTGAFGDKYVEIFVELTVLFFEIELFIAAVRVRKYKAKLEEIRRKKFAG